MNSAKNNRQTWIICLLLAGAVAAVYWPVHRFEFVEFDDPAYLTGNSHVQNGLTLPDAKWAFCTGHCSNWHPLTWLSHMFDWQLFGDKSGGHHAVNLVFHIANTLLLFLVLKRMTGALWRSAFVAALFGLHPLHVESVAWVSERKDVLSTFFWMLTMWAYGRFVEVQSLRFKVQSSQSEKEHSTFNIQRSTFKAGEIRRSMFNVECSMFYFLALLFFALGLMCKSMLVTLPFVLLLLDFWPLNRMSKIQNPKSKVEEQPHAVRAKLWTLDFRLWTPLLLEKIPFFALAAASSAVTFFVQKSGGAVAPLEKLGFGPRVTNALVAYAHYVKSMFWPKDLAPLYPHPGEWPMAEVLAAILILAAISAAMFWWRRRSPAFVVGWLWYLGTLVPVIGLVQIGVQAYADRYTYVPLIGLFIAIAWGVPELTARWKCQPIIFVLAPAVLLGCLAATSVQVKYWENTGTLFDHAVKVTKDNAIAHRNLGFYLAKHGQFEEAIAHYQIALEINPDYTDAHNNLAFAYSQTKRPDEAIHEYTVSLTRKPEDAQAHNNLGGALADLGRWDEALLHFAKAVELDPVHADAQYNWGLALARQKKFEEAIQHYNEAIRIKPAYAAAHSNLGNALLNLNKIAEARTQYLEALKLKPEDVAARNNLGSTYLREDKFEEAIAAYREALRYNPANVQAHFNLGLALVRVNKSSEAAAEFQEALRINPNFAEAREQLNQLSGGAK